MFIEKNSENLKGKTKEIAKHKACDIMTLVGKIIDLKSGVLTKIVNRIIQRLERAKNVKNGIERTNELFGAFV